MLMVVRTDDALAPVLMRLFPVGYPSLFPLEPTQRNFEHLAGPTGHVGEIAMEVCVGGCACHAFIAVTLECRELHDDVGQMPGTFTGNRRRCVRHACQHVVPITSRRRWTVI